MGTLVHITVAIGIGCAGTVLLVVGLLKAVELM